MSLLIILGGEEEKGKKGGGGKRYRSLGERREGEEEHQGVEETQRSTKKRRTNRQNIGQKPEPASQAAGERKGGRVEGGEHHQQPGKEAMTVSSTVSRGGREAKGRDRPQQQREEGGGGRGRRSPGQVKTWPSPPARTPAARPELRQAVPVSAPPCGQHSALSTDAPLVVVVGVQGHGDCGIRGRRGIQDSRSQYAFIKKQFQSQSLTEKSLTCSTVPYVKSQENGILLPGEGEHVQGGGANGGEGTPVILSTIHFKNWDPF